MKVELKNFIASMNTEEDKKLFIKSYYKHIKEKRWNKATKNMNIWDAVKQELLEQNDRALLGHTKAKVALFINGLGYDTRYSGKLKQMFIVANKISNDEGIPQLNEIIPMVRERFSDLPFGIRAKGY